MSFNGRGFNFVKFFEPTLENILEIIDFIESVVYFIEFDAVVGGNDAYMENILFIDDMVQFAILLVLHPHASAALIKCHMHHSIEEYWFGIQ